MINPIAKIILRGDDPTGHGYYGAKRGNRKHFGVDILATPGDKIVIPFSGVITKLGQVYKATTLFRYVEVTSDVYRARLMYVLPEKLKINQRVFEGHLMGYAQDVASYWDGGMLNHIHYQLWKHGLLTDPEPLLT